MEPVTGLAAVLGNIGDIVTSAISWMGDFVGTITASGNEIILLFVLVPIIGLGVGLLRRMISL